MCDHGNRAGRGQRAIVGPGEGAIGEAIANVFFVNKTAIENIHKDSLYWALLNDCSLSAANDRICDMAMRMAMGRGDSARGGSGKNKIDELHDAIREILLTKSDLELLVGLIEVSRESQVARRARGRKGQRLT